VIQLGMIWFAVRLGGERIKTMLVRISEGKEGPPEI
jgi:hypothetical protein